MLISHNNNTLETARKHRVGYWR